MAINGKVMNRKYLLILLFPELFFASKAQITTSSFATKVDFTTGSSSPAPNYFTTGDLNLDGKTDVVIPNSANNTISVFKNTSSGGTISFATKIDSNTLAGAPISGAIGDLNGDGLPDIILNYGNIAYFSVFKNISTGGNILLAARNDFAASYTSGAVTLADIDGDGKLDVLLTNFNNNSISIYRNTSTVSSISFGTPYTVSSGTGPAVIVTADFDGDGKVDIAVSNFTGTTIYVYKNTSSGTTISLGTPLSLAAGSAPNGIAVGDVDGDGKMDIATANYNSANISVYRNTSSTGSISFATQVNFGTTGSSGPQGISLSDIDGDNKPDLCVANRNSASVSVFKNQSTTGTITTSSFASRVEFNTGTQPAGLLVNDIDNDGRLDIITANNIGGSFSILRNQIIAISATVAGSSINFSGITSNSMKVTFTKGNGARRIVLCKASSTISIAPISGTTYIANSIFGSGSQIGTGNYAVYSDSGTTFNLTGLTANTTYYFAVFEYNGNGGFANYLITTFVTGNQATLTSTGILSVNYTPEKSIKLFPIPLMDVLNISSVNGENIIEVSIFDMEGKEILKGNNDKINVSILKDGIYISKVTTDKEVYYQKVIK